MPPSIFDYDESHKHPIQPPFQHPKWVNFRQISRTSDDLPMSTIDQLIILDTKCDVSGSYPQHIMQDSEGRDFVVKWQFRDDAREKKMRARDFQSAVIINPRMHEFMDGQIGIRVEDEDFDDIYLFDITSVLLQALNLTINAKRLDGSWNECHDPSCKKPDPTQRCSGCKTVFYCDATCQKKGWKPPAAHKHTCATMAALHRLKLRLGIPNINPE
ncbi:hypothetical protein DL93DRAFT_2167491 [Clavulina sp. PMI_390]|nr:hypothetical protein DL93DRAFT_2167491 [Clavulina sp. PMI_390]